MTEHRPRLYKRSDVWWVSCHGELLPAWRETLPGAHNLAAVHLAVVVRP